MKRHLYLLLVAILLPLGCGKTDPTSPFATLSVATATLSDGIVTVAYDAALGAAGGDEGYSWAVTVGALPAGLSLASSGTITGTPTAEGSTPFTVQVTSGDGQTATQALTIVIGGLPVLLASDLCSTNPSYSIASFADVNLEAKIRADLGIGGGDDLTCQLASGLTSLSAGDLGITSLVGMQNLTSLTSLSLFKNAITDVSALSGLTSLTSLYLWINSITDISPLSGLTNLTILDVSRNAITDVSAVSALTALTRLWIGTNSITDVSPVSGLTNLTWLHISRTSITDLSPLSGLTSLTDLFAYDGPLVDIGPLSTLTSLTDLDLYGNSITDIGPLATLTSLTNLALDRNSITDIGPLGTLTGLTTLDLASNPITDVSTLEGLTNLTTLSLRQLAGLTDIQPLLDNTGLGAGDEVDLGFSGVSCADIALLAANGVTVQHSCAPFTSSTPRR